MLCYWVLNTGYEGVFRLSTVYLAPFLSTRRQPSCTGVNAEHDMIFLSRVPDASTEHEGLFLVVDQHVLCSSTEHERAFKVA